jgi:hypothetical protein
MLRAVLQESFNRSSIGLLELLDLASGGLSMGYWLSGVGLYYLLIGARTPDEESWDYHSYSSESERFKVVDSQGHDQPGVRDLEVLAR